MFALDLLRSILKGFPFISEADRSVALALLITPVVRYAIRSAPMTAISAPKMASGKNLLASLPAYLATGREPALVSQAETPEEERKRLLALLLEGSTVTVIDNCERPLRSDVLCTALTEPVIRGRLLGMTRTVSAPTTTTWVATENNLHISGDLSSRTLLCTLDPQCERPEERKFSVDLHEQVPKFRGELVSAALTIVRAYIVAGCPDGKVPVFGRYEEWSRYVRQPLVWLGLPDPCETKRVIEARDSVRNELGNLLQAWYDAFGSMALKVADAIKETETNAALKTALEAIAEERGGRINSRRLGNYISRHERRIERGLRFERDDDKQGVAMWRVRKQEA